MKAMKGLAKLIAVGTILTLGSGACLTRPVGQQPPTTKVNFSSTISQQAVDKVDLLLMIDNSASMGDKQTILADAVPDLITGLIKPHCRKLADDTLQTQLADPTGSKDN